MTNIIVFHTAWMDKYDGDRASFGAGGFKFAVKNGYGHEMLNFRSINGSYYGYVPPTGDLHLEKYFDVSRDVETLEGATIVWTAPHPEKGGRAVVGVWHKATVYRFIQTPSGRLAHSRMIEDEIADYRCTAKAKDCMLLSPDDRPLFMQPRQPRLGQSWPGMQSVFYPKPRSPAYEKLIEILEHIGQSSAPQSKLSAAKKAKRFTWQVDVEKRRQIEVAAVNAVGLHLERQGFTIESVEKDNFGYDLVASRRDEVLHVEVKGRSGKEVSADLSVNEYDCLKRYQRHPNPDAHYRIAIVTDALAKPIITELVKLYRKSDWFSLDGQWRLKFEDREAARLTAVSTFTVSK